MQRALLILNPIPWSRKAWRKLPTLVTILEDAGIRAELSFTKLASSMTESVERAVNEGHDLVIVGGGDGTVSEVATGLIRTGVPLGILPFGTFNNIAHSLSIPLDLEEAARTIVRGKSLEIDVGQANGTHFFEAAGVGLDASLFPIGEEIKGGHYDKIMRGANKFLRYHRAEFTVIADGQEVRIDTPLVVIANGPYYGAGFTVAPQASMTDGLLDVINFECNRMELARQFALTAWNRQHHEACVASFRSRELKVLASPPVPFHVDGRPLGHVPVTLGVMPQALRVIVP